MSLYEKTKFFLDMQVTNESISKWLLLIYLVEWDSKLVSYYEYSLLFWNFREDLVVTLEQRNFLMQRDSEYEIS